MSKKVINVIYDENDIVKESIEKQLIELVNHIKETSDTEIKTGFREHVDGSTIATISNDDVIVNFVHESLWIMDEKYADETYGKNNITFKPNHSTMLWSIQQKI